MITTSAAIAQLDGPILPAMATLSPGAFTMGCTHPRDTAIGACLPNEQPAHPATLRAFRIAKHETTFAEWDACSAAGACRHVDDQGWGRGSRPVIHVNWQDGQTYIAWLNRSTGRNFRLPTEAEWEYAARAGANSTYAWGNQINCTQAAHNNRDCGLDMTRPVGSYLPNAYGLHDMGGNVWEWVDDWYAPYQADGSPPQAQAKRYRVLRGGSWSDMPGLLRPAYRGFQPPSQGGFNVGFRLAEDA